MASHALPVSEWLLLAGCVGASLYAVVAALALPFFGPRGSTRSLDPFVPVRVSVLKPLCGVEPRLYENLRSFCEQRLVHFQLVFGVGCADDPAIAVVCRLQAAYPMLDIELVIDARVHGSNLKVSNLINMAERARHDVIVIADSDIAVEADYLSAVAAPLADPSVGVVTCLYVAHGVSGFWSRVGALFVNEWFGPSVRVAHMARSRRFGFGATLALRRETLERIGGFGRLKNCLADDYWLAEHVRALGLRTVLSRMMVATDVTETTFTALWQRETRWLRTIRSVNPLGFTFLFMTFATPWLVVGVGLTACLVASQQGPLHGWPAHLTAVNLAAGLAARVVLHARAVRQQQALHRALSAASSDTLSDAFGRAFWRDLPLVPLRDSLLFVQWIASAFGSHVMWRGARVPVGTSRCASRGAQLPLMDTIEASDGR
ncbi:bacteriohopanetetrol glucosamine biosynthesis glycosyltransferase HpnI [Paraburkholderia graminis]|uniref:Ceramide glucosyltransferase n=1 Tax=Paraburkholderia graminis TaxID=60548 RepID=A0ABD5CUA6_9BURK|nr:bacteriohopanetetrol glucosamine biosynthesis glycosyltransferase HpnI [Paraburkholderia graminis]MDR6207989.1 ceramide glucosyltransferase [Paraburkholderia graminis]